MHRQVGDQINDHGGMRLLRREKIIRRGKNLPDRFEKDRCISERGHIGPGGKRGPARIWGKNGGVPESFEKRERGGAERLSLSGEKDQTQKRE